MTSPDQEAKPEERPVEAERAKLRKAGYTDTEISQILIARALGTQQQPAGPAGPGVMSNVLSSIVAVASHARAAIPSFKKDFVTIFDGAAPLASRAAATLYLVLKTAVIVVLGYAAWQEWNQHIISATEIAAIQARKLHAEECSARMKAYVDNVPVSRLLEGNEELARDCDPTYAARAKACDAKFQAFLDDIDHINMADPEIQKKMTDKATKFRSECTLTEAQRQTLAAKSAGFKAKSDEAQKNLEGLSIAKDSVQADIEHKAGHYEEAFKLSQKAAAAAEAYDVKKSGKAGDLTAGLFVGVAWHALFARKFPEALAASERSIQIKPDGLAATTNRAHALMFLGRTDEAKIVYVTNKGKPLQKKTWELVIADDFAALRKAGISHPMMEEVERELGLPVQAAVSASAAVASPVAALSPPLAKTTAAVTADQLTLRTGPDKTTEAIVVLNKGAQVEVISTDANGWHQVVVVDNGKSFQGYVSGKFMTQDLTASPIPVLITEPYDLSRPSFCGSEAAPMEYVICSNDDLASEDSAMARSYNALLARSNDPDAVRRSQRQWLSNRSQNCNVPASGRPTTRGIPAFMVQCVMQMDEARKQGLRMGRY